MSYVLTLQKFESSGHGTDGTGKTTTPAASLLSGLCLGTSTLSMNLCM
ncbi:class III lanthipeptide [Brevibacterium aurantiacum]